MRGDQGKERRNKSKRHKWAKPMLEIYAPQSLLAMNKRRKISSSNKTLRFSCFIKQDVIFKMKNELRIDHTSFEDKLEHFMTIIVSISDPPKMKKRDLRRKI